jgi:hypothetical protein
MNEQVPPAHQAGAFAQEATAPACPVLLGKPPLPLEVVARAPTALTATSAASLSPMPVQTLTRPRSTSRPRSTRRRAAWRSVPESPALRPVPSCRNVNRLGFARSVDHEVAVAAEHSDAFYCPVRTPHLHVRARRAGGLALRTDGRRPRVLSAAILGLRDARAWRRRASLVRARALAPGEIGRAQGPRDGTRRRSGCCRATGVRRRASARSICASVIARMLGAERSAASFLCSFGLRTRLVAAGAFRAEAGVYRACGSLPALGPGRITSLILVRRWSPNIAAISENTSWVLAPRPCARRARAIVFALM